MQENDSADDRSSPDAISACGNGRALASLLLTFAGATLVVPLVVSFVASPAPASAAPIAAALSVVLVVLGASAAASQFAERLAGRPVSSVARAFAAAPRIVLGSVLLALLLSGAGAVFALVAAIVLVACRLPVVGPVLYAVAVPALTLAGAALLLALAAAALLTLPALWEQHALRTALAQSWAIVARRRQRAVAELTVFVLVAALAAVVLSACLFVVFEGMTAVAVPLAGIASPPQALAAFAAGWPSLGAASLPAPVRVGAALLLATALALLTAVVLSGLLFAYRRSSDGIDIAVARATVARVVVELQVKKSEAIEEAGSLLQRMRRPRERHPDAAPPPVRIVSSQLEMATASALEAERPRPACAHCAASAQPGDLYCGNCGRRLSPPLVA